MLALCFIIDMRYTLAPSLYICVQSCAVLISVVVYVFVVHCARLAVCLIDSSRSTTYALRTVVLEFAIYELDTSRCLVLSLLL